MNNVMFDRAMKVIDELTVEELYEGLTAAGFIFVIRQFPEQLKDEDEENEDD